MVKFLMAQVKNPMDLFDIDVEGMKKVTYTGLTSTPIHYAAGILISRDFFLSKINYFNTHSMDILFSRFSLSENGHLDVIKYLIKFTGNHSINVIGYNGDRPIMSAVRSRPFTKNHFEVVKFLAQFVENPNEGNAGKIVSEDQNRGYTPINYAVQGGLLDVIKFLAPLCNNVNGK